MNDTVRRFPRTLDEVRFSNPQWKGKNRPFETESNKVIKWLIFWLVVMACTLAGVLFYSHVSSAVAQSMREESRIRATEKRIQVLCGDNSSNVSYGNGEYRCMDKHGRSSKKIVVAK